MAGGGARWDGGQGPPRPRLFGPRFWMLLLGLLARNWVLSRVLVGFGPALLLVGLFGLLARRAAGGGAAGALGGFGRSRARRYEPESGRWTSFADVAGIDQVEDEVAEVVDFLRNPDRYRRLGHDPKGGAAGRAARHRQGACSPGPWPARPRSPSTSCRPRSSSSSSSGRASRVRDLFEQAKHNAPAIIVIDELDAIGRARGGSLSVGGHDERDQTSTRS